MPTILITGASSGLGLAFLRHYATTTSNTTIIALDRCPLPASAPHSQSIIFCPIDVTSESAVSALFTSPSIADRPIDLVIHSAGVRGLVSAVEEKWPDDVARAEGMEVMDAETMERTFRINSLGTFLVLRACVGGLVRAARKDKAGARDGERGGADGVNGAGGARPEGGRRPMVVVMASRMGSIGHNTSLGSAYAYRASKAAVNAIVRSFAVDVPEVNWQLVHPGRVETGLVKCREEGAVEAQDAVEDLVKLFGELDGNASGGYCDRFGVTIPW